MTDKSKAIHEIRQLMYDMAKHVYMSDSCMRSYHGWHHITQARRTLHELWPNFNPSVEDALVFHDIVHVPGGGGNNERMSGQMLVHYARVSGFDRLVTTVKHSVFLLRQTVIEHHLSRTWLPHNDDVAIVMDCDLSQLADPNYESFCRTQVSLAKEYWGPGIVDDVPKLTEVLQQSQSFITQFLDKPKIYHMPESAKMESMARANIERFVEQKQLVYFDKVIDLK